MVADGVLCNDRSEDGWGLYGKPHSLSYVPYPDNILSPVFSKETVKSDMEELINKQKKMADGILGMELVKEQSWSGQESRLYGH